MVLPVLPVVPELRAPVSRLTHAKARQQRLKLDGTWELVLPLLAKDSLSSEHESPETRWSRASVVRQLPRPTQQVPRNSSKEGDAAGEDRDLPEPIENAERQSAAFVGKDVSALAYAAPDAALEDTENRQLSAPATTEADLQSAGSRGDITSLRGSNSNLARVASKPTAREAHRKATSRHRRQKRDGAYLPEAVETSEGQSAVSADFDASALIAPDVPDMAREDTEDGLPSAPEADLQSTGSRGDVKSRHSSNLAREASKLTAREADREGTAGPGRQKRHGALAGDGSPLAPRPAQAYLASAAWEEARRLARRHCPFVAADSDLWAERRARRAAEQNS